MSTKKSLFNTILLYKIFRPKGPMHNFKYVVVTANLPFCGVVYSDQCSIKTFIKLLWWQWALSCPLRAFTTKFLLIPGTRPKSFIFHVIENQTRRKLLEIFNKMFLEIYLLNYFILSKGFSFSVKYI